MATLVHFVRLVQKRPILVLIALVSIALPFLASWGYNALTAFPKEITIATGRKGGEYVVLSENLANRIETQLNIKVQRLSSNGSLENLLFLQTGQADFALYQPGVWEVMKKYDPDGLAKAEADLGLLPGERKDISFVANLYSQPAHLFVRREANISRLADLEGKTVAVGVRHSGDYAMSLTLLDHFNLMDKTRALQLEFQEIEQAFAEEKIDAAFYTMGVHAPFFRDLAKTEHVRLLGISNGQALAANHMFIYPYQIPAGSYSYLPVSVPDTTLDTVAAGAQFLTRSDVDSSLVEAITRIVLDKNFIRENQLGELSAGGYEFALRKPEFPIHLGAQNVYEPELRPLVNPLFVAFWEDIRSFVFSAIIAIALAWQWVRRRREHKLEQFIEALLEIERKQMTSSRRLGAHDVNSLRELLAEVTHLRQEALHKFAAHEFSGDRAAECFIQMCHSLSNKINAKMSRLQLDSRFNELTEVIRREGS